MQHYVLCDTEALGLFTDVVCLPSIIMEIPLTASAMKNFFRRFRTVIAGEMTRFGE
jgi:hypothetical protein